MKIISLTASNVKRLKAVEITPDGTVQIVGGRNAQGKTSVLDAIWLALGGGPAAKATTRPIRDGETTAKVVLDLGEFIVTRTWAEGKSSVLTVTSTDGAKYSSPQSILDALVGRLAFDPLEFTRKSAREQRDALLALVDLPFDPADLHRRRQAIFDERTDIGRRVTSLKGRLDGLPEVDAPDVEVSATAILDELRAASETSQRIDAVYTQAERIQSSREAAQEQLDLAQAALNLLVAQEKDAAAAIKSLPRRPDVAEIEQRLASVDEVNSAVRAKAERARVAAEVTETRAAYDAKTAALAALDKEKADGLAAAAFPVEGLGFDESGVTFQGVPFSQASSAEQIRVSLAMAMSLNPKLRVIRILDGSLLDSDSLALITEMAAAQDYQVWVERVGDADAGAVIIEDGEVAA